MTAILYVVLTAGGIILWGLLSSWFPRLGLVANSAALVVVIRQIITWRSGPTTELEETGLFYVIGFGTLTLMIITVLIGFVAALAGLVEERRDRRERASDDVIPRATIVN